MENGGGEGIRHQLALSQWNNGWME